MDDGNMPKEFQKILVHGFQEIGLHHLQPFLVFLEIHASIEQNFSMGKCIMMRETCLESFRSIQSTIWEIWTKQVIVLQTHNNGFHRSLAPTTGDNTSEG